MASPTYLDRKIEFATAVHRLHQSLTDVSEELRSFNWNGESVTLTDDGQAYFDAALTRIHHEFDLASDLAQSNPADIFSTDYYPAPDETHAPTSLPTFGLDERDLTVETVHESLDEAWAQFSVTVAPVLDALANGNDISLDDSDWLEFYGRGFGHSHARTVRTLLHALARDIAFTAEPTAEDVDHLVATLDPDRSPEDLPGTTVGGTPPTSTEDESSPVTTSDSEQAERLEIPDSGSETETESSETQSESSDDSSVDADVDADSDRKYTKKPPADATVLRVEESATLPRDRPNCCSAKNPVNAKYDVVVEGDDGEEVVYHTCGSHVPDKARGITPRLRIIKHGDNIGGDGPTATVKVGANGNSWSEYHFVGDHDERLANIQYKKRGDTINITVFDGLTEHGREGTYSVDIDDYDGGVPIVDGQPIDEWLDTRAQQHFDRIHENDGVQRHLVDIDNDASVIARARRAYRNKNPDFEQPSGMINDHTPVVEECIPVCVECGEIVAGTTLENTEECEYCGCDEAEWMSDQRDEPENDNGPNEVEA